MRLPIMPKPMNPTFIFVASLPLTTMVARYHRFQSLRARDR